MANVYVDGLPYEASEEIPDLGSLVCIEIEGKVRHYQGLSADADKLPTRANNPKYRFLASGSSCLMLDTGDYYRYLQSNDTWYNLSNVSSGGTH